MAADCGHDNEGRPDVKSYNTVTEIPQELITLWETAWQAQPTKDNPFVVELESEKEVNNFRQHMYMARKQLTKEHYPGAQQFNKLSIINLGGNRVGIVLPSWFSAVQTSLEKAGVELPGPEILPTAPPASPTELLSDAEREAEENLPENLRTIQALFKNPLEGDSK